MDKDKEITSKALTVSYFPHGIRAWGAELGENALRESIDCWLDEVKDQLYKIAFITAPSAETYCVYEPVLKNGKICRQLVCYDQAGNVVSRGPVMCPAGPNES